MKASTSRGASLAVKFSVLMISLVIMIAAGVAVPLILQMIPREQKMLAEGLRARASILIESVASRATAAVRSGEGGFVTVLSLPLEISAMPNEAISMTISGPRSQSRTDVSPSEDPGDRDYLWATNDPAYNGVEFDPGEIPVSDPVMDPARVADLATRLNEAAASAIAKLSRTGGTSEAEAEVESVLARLAGEARHSGSFPEFDAEKPAPTYLFYRPLAAASDTGSFFIGLVRLVISTQTIVDRVTAARDTLLRSAGLIALAAVVMGGIGAIALASIATRPIGKLARAVKVISSAADQERLEEISVGPRDEIGMLTETVNDMIRGLVSKAKQDKDMTVGRDIQKQFLPLGVLPNGAKGSTGGILDATIDLYAYYEGATKVSGDYFDWQKLDDQFYALIKCDVSGHGSPAAFIMVEVATLFLRWCRQWKARLTNLGGGDRAAERAKALLDLRRLDSLVYTINDMIVDRGFSGMFAAFMICLYDVKTGEVIACNAGDNMLYWHDARKRSMVSRSIDPKSPAAGAFMSDMVKGGPGFPQVTQRLERGDVLVLVTDGFEESHRTFRAEDGAEAACTDESHTGGVPLATHKKGELKEEFSIPRILAVFDAFFAKRTYRLERHHTAGAETLEFDFTGCSNTLEEAVLALVSVERVYRTFHDPQTEPKDRIEMETKVDDFLAKHFRQYASYFGEQPQHDPKATYRAITGIKEDIQDDDLTVVLLRRP